MTEAAIKALSKRLSDDSVDESFLNLAEFPGLLQTPLDASEMDLLAEAASVISTMTDNYDHHD
jgi:hypothetical protein